MKIIFTLICTCLSFFASAQRCATTEYSRLNPVSRNMINASIARGAGVGSRDTLSDEVITIPVVIHVLYNNAEQNISDLQIKSQIDALNKDYRRLNADAVNTPAPFSSVAADTRIVFCLAKVDPEGKPTTGIIRKYTRETVFMADDKMKFSSTGGDDAWDASRYLNLWVCNLFGQTLGYAVLPGSPAEKDGVVIRYSVFGTTGVLAPPYTKGRTATHEIGHWLGLQHLWGDAECGDDGIDDTPKQETSNTYCPTFPHTSSCSINQYGDMFMNFMDFTDDACMNLFTQGQKKKMRSLFAKGGLKNSFLSSNVCTSPDPEPGPVVDDSSKTNLITTYPNPFVNEITIFSENADNVVGKKLKIFDMAGRLISSQVIESKKTTLYLRHLPRGVYVLKVEEPQRWRVYKIIKQ